MHYDCQGDLSGHWDASRPQQMLSNLVGNAIQHGLPGTAVTVLARGEDEQVVVTVHNERPPIAPEMIDRILDPLMRGVVQEAERRNRQASLGLTQAHDGDSAVTSSQEAGTTFTATLPRAGR
ncbi:ATP-binding protein [Azohydromonas aeria]|uniref:ATP-binding protein n=1 Tax=Azohydromonas aeria TaxID=2590212 RepID=UPI0035C24C5F